MLPEIGHFLLILAFAVAVVQSTVPLLNNERWRRVALSAAWLQFSLIAVSYLILSYLFLSNDFSVEYIAKNSNTRLPWWYQISAVWSSHEGSLLLWLLMLSGWTVVVAWSGRRLTSAIVAKVLAVMGMVSVGFLSFTLATSNPFNRLLPDIPADGRDINPLLQDPGLIFHPPLLYMGYVGFAVAFAFAIAALISGRLDHVWVRWMRPWTLLAWSFLTAGIVLGSWWAYRELGWGGWWFWDPVENASLLPWLVGTALIHSLIVVDKRNTFKSWTVLLAITAFSLSLLGTFLVRSGVLTSVHAFANDPERGQFLLIFLFIVVGLSLLLFAWRANSLREDTRFTLLSKETLLLGNNILLIVAMATVLLGTIYPLILDGLRGIKISVGAPYFNAVIVPLLMPLFFIMGVGPLTRWQSMSPDLLWHKLRFAFGLSIAVSIILWLALSDTLPALVLIALVMASWILFTTVIYFIDSVRTKKSFRLTAGAYGMVLAHAGLAITIIGVAVSVNYSVERDVRMEIGDTVAIHNYEFYFKGTEQRPGPNYTSLVGLFDVSYKGHRLATLNPQKREHFVSRNVMTKADTNVTWQRDLYIALGEPLSASAWAVRVYYKPFIRWIWLGGILMALGALVAASDRRYRESR